MPISNLPMARMSNFVIQELSNETLVYDLNNNKAYCLNETSALIWRLCNGKNSVSEISSEISKQFKKQVSEDFVWVALDQLKAENLLSNGEEIETKFKGLDRRRLIKEVGIASMIALPIVSSITAPQAANAQSAPCPAGAFRCIQAGDDICAGCVGFTLMVQDSMSTNATCGGTSPTSTNHVCVGPEVRAVDVRVT